jgi:hypothetical protein
MALAIRDVRSWGGLVAAVLLFVGIAAPLAAAQTPASPPRITQDLPEADFLFGPPRGSIAVRGSLLWPGERSDLFTFVQEQLTIDQGDFRTVEFGADIAFSLSPRFDVLGSVDLARRSIGSEYREFVDNDLRPIEQRTSLNQTAITASVRYALIPRGRRVGTFAWIPSRVQPYIGAGGGLLVWRFQQNGDFVDFQDFDVFPEVFTSNGVAPVAHVLGGTDIQVYKRLMLTAEGRYQWASGELDNDFIGFEPLDLSGFRASVGLRFVF